MEVNMLKLSGLYLYPCCKTVIVKRPQGGAKERSNEHDDAATCSISIYQTCARWAFFNINYSSAFNELHYLQCFLLRLLQFRLLSFQMNPFAYDNEQGTGRLTSVGAVRSVIFEMFALITVNLEEGWGKWERDKQLRFLFFGRRAALLFSYGIIVWGEGMESPSGGIAKPGKVSADWFGIRQYGWRILTFNLLFI